MDIQDDNRMGPVGTKMPLSAVEPEPDARKDFARMLDAEILKAEVSATRDAVLKNQKQVPNPLAQEDIAYIREHGMQAYAEELHKQKIEEMRAKILASMGLSEEALSEMSGSQRSTIEQMINDEIQNRIEANSLMNKDPANDNDTYLNSMMMTDQNGALITDSAANAAIKFREHFAQIFGEDTAYTFVNGDTEEK